MENLSTKNAITGIAACFRNSFSLLEDANILLDSNKFCRSFALSQFAIEEVGKSLILFEVYFKLLIGKRAEINFSEVRKNFLSHTSKSTKTVLMEYKEHPVHNFPDSQEDEFIKRTLKELDDSKSKYDNQKNQSLYVSYEKGVFKMPEEFFTMEVAKNHILKAKRRITVCSGYIIRHLSIISDARSEEKASLIQIKEVLNNRP